VSRFREELDLVPRTAWAIAVCAWLGIFLMMMLLPFRLDPEGRTWPLAAKLVLSALPSTVLFALVLLIGYVHMDAKRRGMRYILWTLLAIFIPNAIGIILYFILRDPLLVPCPHCGAAVRQGFAFCPNCGTALARACPQCRRAIEPGWSHCPNCGVSLKA
jgi:RNA polymerase subunit RPABC4/transcription elongation factor Spt4